MLVSLMSSRVNEKVPYLHLLHKFVDVLTFLNREFLAACCASVFNATAACRLVSRRRHLVRKALTNALTNTQQMELMTAPQLRRGELERTKYMHYLVEYLIRFDL